jgi:hypothetical protein
MNSKKGHMMTKVIVRVEVEDVERWKRGFVTHAELFVRQAVTLAYSGVGEENRVAACFETSDIDAFMEVMASPATAEAMSNDGIVEGSVEVYVADTIFDPNS